MPAEKVHEATEFEYEILEIISGTAEKVILKGIQGYSNYVDSSGYNVNRFTFCGTNLTSTPLPLEANPREPGESTPVKRMKKTLENEPHKFHLYNNGMTIFATKCEPIMDNSGKIVKVELTFDRAGQGICNGGHTYYACHRAIIEGLVSGDFHVNAEVIILPSKYNDDDYKKSSVNISRARNLNNKLKPASIADQLGYFDKLQKLMIKHRDKVSWHENDRKAIAGSVKAEDLLRYLAALSPQYYKHSIHLPNGKSHKAACMTATSGVWNPWMNSMDSNEVPKIAPMYVLADEIIELRDNIAHRIKNSGFTTFRRSNFWRKYMCNQKTESDGTSTTIPKTRDSLTHAYEDDGTGKKCPVPVSKYGDNVDVLIVGLLRDLVTVITNNKGKTTYVGWYVNPIEVLDSLFDTTMTSLHQDFRTANDEPTVFCRSDSPYKSQIITWQPPVTNPPDDPHELVDCSTGTRFRLEPKGKATHRLVSGVMTDNPDPVEPFKWVKV